MAINRNKNPKESKNLFRCSKIFLIVLITVLAIQPATAQEDFSEFDMDLGVTEEASDSSSNIQSELNSPSLFDDLEVVDPTAESNESSVGDVANEFEDFDDAESLSADTDERQDDLFDSELSQARDTFVTESEESYTADQNTYQASGQVIYEKQTDLTGSYKERRPKMGILFSVNYESFYPVDYFSLIHNQYFDELLGSQSFKVVGAEFGLKYNFSLGSLGVLLGFGMGSLNDDAVNVSDMKVQIQKLALIYTMDNLFNEPYVAPFAQVGIHRFDWVERGINGGAEQEESTVTGMTYHFKAGLSFQLNWIEKSIDPNSHIEALRSSGLQNTYLDVFYSYYAEPTTVAEANGSDGDPNLSSAEVGVGLKMEF